MRSSGGTRSLLDGRANHRLSRSASACRTDVPDSRHRVHDAGDVGHRAADARAEAEHRLQVEAAPPRLRGGARHEWLAPPATRRTRICATARLKPPATSPAPMRSTERTRRHAGRARRLPHRPPAARAARRAPGTRGRRGSPRRASARRARPTRPRLRRGSRAAWRGSRRGSCAAGRAGRGTAVPAPKRVWKKARASGGGGVGERTSAAGGVLDMKRSRVGDYHEGRTAPGLRSPVLVPLDKLLADLRFPALTAPSSDVGGHLLGRLGFLAALAFLLVNLLLRARGTPRSRCGVGRVRGARRRRDRRVRPPPGPAPSHARPVRHVLLPLRLPLLSPPEPGLRAGRHGTRARLAAAGSPRLAACFSARWRAVTSGAARRPNLARPGCGCSTPCSPLCVAPAAAARRA